MTTPIIWRAAVVGAFAVAAPCAIAQSPDMSPSHGQVDLQADFAPDPRSVAVRAGGAFDAARLDPSCAGYINEAPNLVVEYAAGEGALFLSAASDADTTLAVIAPDGTVLCDDDGGAGPLDPGVRLDDPQSGRYALWVGTYEPGIGLPPATRMVY